MGLPAMRANSARRPIRRCQKLRYDRRGRPECSIVEDGKILTDGAIVGVVRQALATWVAGTTISIDPDQARINSKALPPTSPSAMQCSTIVLNSLRGRSLPRKRAWLFFKKVNWSGTSPSRPSLQSQR